MPVNPLSRIPLLVAKADSLVCKKLDTVARGAIFQAIKEHRVQMDAFHCAEIPGGIYLGTFFGEWKRDEYAGDTCRRAAFSALGIQSQRRALGLKDRHVYGLIQTKGFIHLVTSYWKGASMVRSAYEQVLGCVSSPFLGHYVLGRLDEMGPEETITSC